MAANAKKWYNICVLIELLFSLPASNRCVEHVFSALKVKRNWLSENSLDGLL